MGQSFKKKLSKENLIQGKCWNSCFLLAYGPLSAVVYLSLIWRPQKPSTFFLGIRQLKTPKRQQLWQPRRQQLRIAIFLTLLSGLCSALSCGTPMILRSVKVQGVCPVQNQSKPQHSSVCNQKALCPPDASLAMLELECVLMIVCINLFECTNVTKQGWPLSGWIKCLIN